MPTQKHGIRYTTQSFIEKASIIHDNKFNYSNVLYKNSTSKVNINCPIHGIFKQRPCDHINQKQGCPQCSHNFAYTHDQYIQKSNEKFGDKFVILTSYTGMKHPITIQCKEHNAFTLKFAEKHLEGNGGCPHCWYLSRLENLKPGNISKVEKEWLDSLNVPIRQYKITINELTFIADGFDPITNTVYECYGSFWHGNPDLYNALSVNTVLNKTFGELYEKTLAKESLLRSHYNLITIWI